MNLRINNLFSFFYITQINDSVAQIDQTTKDNVEIANESAIISSTVSDIANNILEDVKKKRF
nr:hypothetical protein [Campylobacter jejuni]